MGYISEEEKLRRIQREAERKKKEEEMLQEEELRHIRELERIRQMNSSEEDDYDPEMDSAFVVADESDGRLFRDEPVQGYGQSAQAQGYGQPHGNVQLPPTYGNVQTPPTHGNVQLPPTYREQESYIETPPAQYVQAPPTYRDTEQYSTDRQPRQSAGQPSADRQQRQSAGQQSTDRLQRQSAGQPSADRQQRQSAGQLSADRPQRQSAGQPSVDRQSRQSQQHSAERYPERDSMRKENTKPVYNDEYDDDDDGADFDVAAYRAAERERKQRMHNRYAETEEKHTRDGKRGGNGSHGGNGGNGGNGGRGGNGGQGGYGGQGGKAGRNGKAGRGDSGGMNNNGGRGEDGGYNSFDNEDSGKRIKKKKRHPIRNLFLFLILLLLVLVIAGGLVLNSILSRFKHFDSEVSKRPESMTGTQLNVLLIGQDAREGEEGQRSDTMILCTINRDNNTVVLTSFMRDMYVDIPGYGGNRINAAFSFGASEGGVEGGVNLLNKTIEEDFGIRIDGNVMVDLTSFLESMTAVGNIDMELTAEEAQYMNENPQAGTATDISDEVWDLHEGMNSLTPSQALCYARMRYVGNSDWDRTERQRKLIMACVSKVKHGHPLSGIKMAKEIAPCISTDLSKTGILKMGWGFLKGGNMQSFRLPVDGYYYDDYIDGMAVLVPDIESNKNLLQDYMSGDHKEE